MSQDDTTAAYVGTGDDTLVRLFEIWQRKAQLSIRSHLPATVTAYDPQSQTVACTVDYLEVERVVGVPGAAAQNLTLPRPPLLLPAVPVVWPGSGDGLAYLTFPLIPGATGMLAVLDRDLATWLTRGAPVPVDPVFSRLHPVSSCVFFPGLLDDLHRIAVPTDLTAAVLEHPVGIKLGRGALPVNRAITILDLAALVDTILAWVPVPNDGGAALKAAVSTWWGIVGAGSLLGSNKVTIE